MEGNLVDSVHAPFFFRFGLDCDCASLPAEVKAQYAPLIEALKQRSGLVYSPSTKVHFNINFFILLRH